jgi:hypothetical protein
VAVYGEVFLDTTTALQRILKSRLGRLASTPPEFAFIAAHRRVCGWFKDLRTLVVSEDYTGCQMESPAVCAELLTLYLSDLDINMEAQYAFQHEEVQFIDYEGKKGKPTVKDLKPKEDLAAAAAAALAKKRAREDAAGEKQDRKQRRRNGGCGGGAPRVVVHDLADAPGAGAVVPYQPPGGKQPLGGRQVVQFKLPDQDVRPLKALRGFCLFHLGGALGMQGKIGQDKPMECYTPVDCPHGSHAQPSAAAARDIAADLQASLDGRGPAVAFSPPTKKLFIAALGRVVDGGR